jgi:ferredoxin
MAYRITDDCISCAACEAECPSRAISEGPQHYMIDPKKCNECASCASVCPVDACQPK